MSKAGKEEAMQVDKERSKYVDMNKLCQDDVEYITHTGFYAPLPKDAKCVHCGATENLGTQEGEVVCEDCAMSQGQ